jgi:signal transduction histidine kinase/FixJ family two-component response regulator
MTSITINVSESISTDPVDLIEHEIAIPPSQTVSEVYEFFQKMPHEFLAVTDGGRVLGMVSRGQVGFLLGARFGVAVYGRKPIGEHMLSQHLCIKRGTPLLEVFETALSRHGDYFYDDVALLDESGNYLGMIPVQTLVRLQSQLIAEQVRLAETQRLELQDKNQQLFRSINELRQSRGRYDILFENSALGVGLLDRHGAIETCNQRLEHLLGIEVSPERARRLSLTDMIQAEEQGSFAQLLHQLEMLPASAAPNSGEFTFSLPGRGPRLFKLFLNWIQETGQICVLLDDISEQRVLERQMQRKEKSALLESLVGGIAHEINNKLCPIIGYIDLLLEEMQRLHTTTDLKRYCLIIRNSAEESAKIIRQLLQLSRPHRVEMSRCDLRQIVREAVDLLRFRLRNLDCQVNISLPDSECLLMADATQVKQVVMNLALNAADAMEGRAIRKMNLQVVPSGKHFHLLLSDTGCGIKPEHLERIFDPFFTTKSPDRGSGLGLSVCYSIVKQHYGEISVESVLGEGTTFKITLPCGEVPALPPIPQPLSQLLSHGTNGSLNSSRVLIADDEEFVAGLVQQALKMKLGCQIDKALDGHEAIEHIRQNSYDVIISDVRMPVLDGFGLLDWIGIHRPALVPRFMFITGDAGSVELNEKLDSCGVTVLRKPFDVETLVEICRQKIKTPAAAVAETGNNAAPDFVRREHSAPLQKLGV